jgi:hypothetical protein
MSFELGSTVWNAKSSSTTERNMEAAIGQPSPGADPRVFWDPPPEACYTNTAHGSPTCHPVVCEAMTENERLGYKAVFEERVSRFASEAGQHAASFEAALRRVAEVVAEKARLQGGLPAADIAAAKARFDAAYTTAPPSGGAGEPDFVFVGEPNAPPTPSSPVDATEVPEFASADPPNEAPSAAGDGNNGGADDDTGRQGDDDDTGRQGDDDADDDAGGPTASDDTAETDGTDDDDDDDEDASGSVDSFVFPGTAQCSRKSIETGEPRIRETVGGVGCWWHVADRMLRHAHVSSPTPAWIFDTGDPLFYLMDHLKGTAVSVHFLSDVCNWFFSYEG